MVEGKDNVLQDFQATRNRALPCTASVICMGPPGKFCFFSKCLFILKAGEYILSFPLSSTFSFTIITKM